MIGRRTRPSWRSSVIFARDVSMAGPTGRQWTRSGDCWRRAVASQRAALAAFGETAWALDGARRYLHPCEVSRPDGRSGKRRKAAGEESPGSTGKRCRITSGGGNPRESATENETASGSPGARVKRCGKSAPRLRQRRRHGKPHREQDRIGAARGDPPGSCPDPAARVGCTRRRAIGVAEEGPPGGGRLAPPPQQTPANRLADPGGGARGKPADTPPV